MATHSRTLFLIVALAALTNVSVTLPASAQSPKFGLGHAPTPAEIGTIDIGVTPEGQGPPPGAQRCLSGAEDSFTVATRPYCPNIIRLATPSGQNDRLWRAARRAAQSWLVCRVGGAQSCSGNRTTVEYAATGRC
jgi:hypothetical protein